MKLPIPAFALAILCGLTPPPVSAHPGNLDRKGCHRDLQDGGTHCHRNALEAEDTGVIRKTRSGVCHGPSSPNYRQIRDYETFRTMRECVNSGGREPL
jgi:hypothetical protein